MVDNSTMNWIAALNIVVFTVALLVFGFCSVDTVIPRFPSSDNHTVLSIADTVAIALNLVFVVVGKVASIRNLVAIGMGNGRAIVVSMLLVVALSIL
jgi:hypothetical protein